MRRRSVRARCGPAKAGRSSGGGWRWRRVKAYWKRARVEPHARGWSGSGWAPVRTWKRGVGAEVVGVVAVGVVGEDLVDLLGEDLFGGVGDEGLSAGGGGAAGEVGEIAEVLVEVADRQQSGVGDEVGGVEGDRNGLPVDVGERKVRGVVGCHEEAGLRVSPSGW